MQVAKELTDLKKLHSQTRLEIQKLVNSVHKAAFEEEKLDASFRAHTREHHGTVT